MQCVKKRAVESHSVVRFTVASFVCFQGGETKRAAGDDGAEAK